MRNRLASSMAVLVALTVAALATPASAGAQGKAEEQPAPRRIEVTILGMSCPFCAYGVEQKLKKLESVEELDVELETGIATLTLEEGADISNETLRETVKQAGFEVAKITRNYESEHPNVGGETSG